MAMYQGELIPPAYGILSDISETGACIHSDKVHYRGQKLHLRIQFAAQPELFETLARVRWIKPAVRGAVAGIEFHPSSGSVCQLRRLLDTSDFEVLDAEATDFEDFLAAMRPFLQKLGGLLDEMSGPGRR
jgi:hypothetical protein